MTVFMITRLPPLPKSLDAVEFMQKNNFSFHLSTNLAPLISLMSSSGGGESPSAGHISTGEEFEQEGEDSKPFEKFFSAGMAENGASSGHESPEERLEEEMSHDDPTLFSPPLEAVHDDVDTVDDQQEEGGANEASFFNQFFSEPLVDVEAVADLLVHAGDQPHGDSMDFGDIKDERESVEENEENQWESCDKEDSGEGEEMKEEGNAIILMESDVLVKADERSEDPETRLLFTCPVRSCPCSYRTFKRLQEHVTIHSNDVVNTETNKENFYCDMCKKEDFSSIASAMAHMRKRERKECCECGQRFTSYAEFLRHTRATPPPRPYSCEYCKKFFSDKYILERHERTHTGEKPFGCGYCERRFAGNGDAIHHIRLHHGEMPYCCEKCDERFNWKGELNYHMNSSHK